MSQSKIDLYKSGSSKRAFRTWLGYFGGFNQGAFFHTYRNYQRILQNHLPTYAFIMQVSQQVKAKFNHMQIVRLHWLSPYQIPTKYNGMDKLKNTS
jgi:hypothetical protein